MAKTEIFKFMRPGGAIILNGDDDKLSTIKEYEGTKPVFFGLDTQREIYADGLVSHGLKGVSCRIHLGRRPLRCWFPCRDGIWCTMLWLLRQWAGFMD